LNAIPHEDLFQSEIGQKAEQDEGLLLEDYGHVEAQGIHGEGVGFTAAPLLPGTSCDLLQVHHQFDPPLGFGAEKNR